ncbi:hypothetical protein D3C71_1761580 [compost metagenome]
MGGKDVIAAARHVQAAPRVRARKAHQLRFVVEVGVFTLRVQRHRRGAIPFHLLKRLRQADRRCPRHQANVRQHEQVRLVDVGKIVETAVELAVQARQVDVVADFLGGGLLQTATDL